MASIIPEELSFGLLAVDLIMHRLGCSLLPRCRFSGFLLFSVVSESAGAPSTTFHKLINSGPLPVPEEIRCGSTAWEFQGKLSWPTRREAFCWCARSHISLAEGTLRLGVVRGPRKIYKETRDQLQSGTTVYEGAKSCERPQVGMEAHEQVTRGFVRTFASIFSSVLVISYWTQR